MKENNAEKIRRRDLSSGLQSPIYRFKFSSDIVDLLGGFAKIHQDDERKEYKNSWEIWCLDNKEELNGEILRLHGLGYEGDIWDKMFKSARYYYRKKERKEKKKKGGNSESLDNSVDSKELESSENITEKDTQSSYITLSVGFLGHIDNHIQNVWITENFTPAKSFLKFCESKQAVLKAEITYILKTYPSFKKDDIPHKIKKTYKNRFFLQQKKRRNKELNGSEDGGEGR